MDTPKPTTAIPPQNLASAYAVPQNLATPTTPLGIAPQPLTPAVAPPSSTTSGIVPHQSSAGILPSQKIGNPTSILPKSDQNFAARFLGSDNRPSRALGLDGRSTRSSLGADGRYRGLGVDGRSRGGSSDETELSKRIIDLHESDEQGLDVKPVLHIIEVIFYRATVDLPGFGIQNSDIVTDDKAVLYSVANLNENVDIPARITNAISCEILSKVSAGVDVHTITMEILQKIKRYGWDSKVLLALIAFAVTFGEFRLVLQLYSSNPLAKSVALLKQLPEILEHAGALRPKLEALNDLIKEILDVAKKIVDFYELLRNNEHISAESPEILAAASHIPTAVYWTIRSIVVSATQIFSLTGMGIEYLTEPWELSSLAHKLNSIKGHVVDIINGIRGSIERELEEQAFQHIVRTFANQHIDNSKPLRVLFNEDPQALYDCVGRRRILIDDLRRKVVALFITDLDPELTRLQEYSILQQMYMEKRHSATRTESQYDVVWVPITDNWTDEKYRQFERLRDQMEWHSVHHPSVLTRVVHRFIREKWNFSKKPLLVVIDTQGRVVHLNAIHMMCIWGSLSYPFTTNREKLLWDETSWTIDLLVDGLDPNVVTWIQEQRHICLYGGEDIDWIRKFTRVAKEVARESGISLELLYVGKSKPHEKATRNIIETLIKENLSRTLDWNLIWYFWVRLESMWHSKGQLTTAESVKTDRVMQGIIAMLSYGSSSQGWAVISRGYGEMVKANGEHIYKGLSEHGRWKPREDEIGFVPALDEHLKKIHLDTPHHCTSLILPATGAMPETVACSECGRLMERFTMFRCCLDY